MKRVKYIKNISANTVSINGYDILPDETVDTSTNLSVFKTSPALANIYIHHYNADDIELYDQNNELMNKDEYLVYYNYFLNRFLSKPYYYRIYEFLNEDSIQLFGDFSKLPRSVDYTINVDTRFERKETFTKGFLTNVEYFEYLTIDGLGNTIYHNPILNVNIKYFVNSSGYVTHREVTRKWMKNTLTYSDDVKITVKKYTELTSKKEAIRRRINILTQTYIDMLYYIYHFYETNKTPSEVEIILIDLLDFLDEFINRYIKGNLNPLITNVGLLNPLGYEYLAHEVGTAYTLQMYVLDKLNEASLLEGEY